MKSVVTSGPELGEETGRSEDVNHGASGVLFFERRRRSGMFAGHPVGEVDAHAAGESGRLNSLVRNNHAARTLAIWARPWPAPASLPLCGICRRASMPSGSSRARIE